MNLYSPPNKGYPQELPDRWRFADGTVRTDLKSLTPQELNALDWAGPISVPVARQKDEAGNDVLETYDYDPATHKSVWYKAKRQYIIVDKNVSETPYLSGELVYAPDKIPNWDAFKQLALRSQSLNSYVLELSKILPIAASAIPSTLLITQSGNYHEFANLWSAVNDTYPVPPELVNEITSAARYYNIPEDFITILKN